MNEERKPHKIYWKALTVGIVLVLALVGCASPPTTTQPYGYLDTVTTTGSGEAYGNPDMATIQLGYSTSDKNIGAALAESNSAIEGVKATLLQMGIVESDIQTTYFSVWPEEQFDPMTGMSSGERIYRVENTVSVVIRNISQVSDVIQACIESGANNVYGLTFGIDNPDLLAAEARTAAVADAQAKAEQLAQALGAQVGEARIANETIGTGGYPLGADLGLGGGGGPPISEGQLKVTIQVNVTFDLVR